MSCRVILDWRCEAFWSNGAAVWRFKSGLPGGSWRAGIAMVRRAVRGEMPSASERE